MKKNNLYKVTFSIDNLTLYEQNQIYNLLNKLDFNLKDNMNILITDPIGGIHDPLNRIGIMPNKNKCKLNCIRVNCSDCPEWNSVISKEDNHESD